jgi:hypothetical protein
MTTLEQRELAGVSPVAQPALPTESKHTLDDRRDEARLHRIEAKELREFNQPMVEYNYHKQLTDALENPYDKIKNQLKEGNYKTITEQEALHTPYRRAS